MRRFLSIVWWLSVCFVCSVGTLRSQPANVQADPTTGALFRPSAAAFISGNNLATATGGIVLGASGGTGVANTGKTITLGGNVTTVGAYNLGVSLSGNTTVTLPTTGTLATLAGSETLTNKTLTSPTLTTPILGVATGTSLALSALTSGRVTFAGASGLLTDDADLTFATDTLTGTKGTFGGITHISNAIGAANSVTAATGQSLTLTGGDSGASLALGATTGGVSTLTAGSAATGYSNKIFRVLNGAGTAQITGTGDGRVYIGPDVGYNSILTVRRSTGNGVTELLNLDDADGLKVIFSNPTATVFSQQIGGSVGSFNWGNSGVSNNQMRLNTASGNLLIGTTTDAASLAGGLVINGSGAGATSSSTSTGALRVTGGVGVSGALNVGGTITDSSGSLTIGAAQINRTSNFVELQYNTTTAGQGVRIFGNTANAITFNSGTIGITNATPSTLTTNGALVVAGGVGVSGAIFANAFDSTTSVTARTTARVAQTADTSALKQGIIIESGLSNGSTTPTLEFFGTGVGKVAHIYAQRTAGSFATSLFLGTSTAGGTVTNALTLDASQAATFAGAVTGASTIQVGTVLRVGGATASFPGLRNTGAQLDVVTASNSAWADIAAGQFKQSDNGISWSSGTGSPEGVKTAPVGSLYSRTDGGVSTTLYVKQTGTGNTGWAAK